MSNVEQTGSELTTVYELGFHLVPSIPEEGITEQFEAIKSHIEKVGGTFVDEQAPQLIDLAYTMEKRQERGYERYERAYFGWVKFEVAPEALEGLNEELETINTLLRTILIKASRENTMIGSLVLAEEKAKEEAESAPEVVEMTTETDTGEIASVSKDEKAEVSDAAIDKGIENLVGDEAEEGEEK